MKTTLAHATALILTAVAWYICGYGDGLDKGFRRGVDATIAEVGRQVGPP